MNDRKHKIEELLGAFRALRQTMTFRSARSAKIPRITPSQWGVLMHIVHGKGSAVKDVAKALDISSSAATQLIDGLVESGYLEKKMSAKDRRVATLMLSKRTKNRVDAMKKNALQKFLKVFAVLSDKELDQYLLLNKKVVSSLVNI